MGQRQAGVDGARRSADGGRILSWVRREWVEAGSNGAHYGMHEGWTSRSSEGILRVMESFVYL